jgi:hypothetical protein
MMIAEKGCGDDHCRGATAAGGVKNPRYPGAEENLLA